MKTPTHLDLVLEIPKALTAVFKAHGMSTVVQPGDLTITENSIMEKTSARRISNAILDQILPQVPMGTMFHFTSEDAAQKIVASKTLRLQSLARRLDEQELRALFEEFQLPWYLGSEYGTPRAKEIADDIYYVSLVPATVNSGVQSQLAATFGRGTPTRLTIEFVKEPMAADAVYGLRAMRYFPTDVNAFALYEDCIKLAKTYNRKFIFWGTTRVSSYVLPDSLKSESEIRFVARGSDYPGLLKSDGGSTWLELPLGAPTPFGVRAELKAVRSL